MTTHHRVRTIGPRGWLVLAALLLLAGPGTSLAELPPALWCPDILTTQHTDVFSPALVGGSLVLLVDDTDDGLLFAPDDVLLYVDRAAKTAQPAGTAWNFLGAGSGNPVWILPQGQNPNLLYAGANANSVNPASVPLYFESDPRVGANGRWIKTSLVDLRGPGEFSMYQTGALGAPTVWMSTFQGGITSSDAIFVQAGGHIHYNWAFTAPGIYEVDVRSSAFLGPNQTQPVASAVTTYYFGVETQLSCPLAVPSLDNRQLLAYDVARRPVVLADTTDGLFTPLAAEYTAQGDLLLADVLKSQIRRVLPDGTSSVFADAADGLTTPSGLAIDGAGNVYVSNYLTNTIRKLNPSGSTSTLFADAADGLSSPFGMDFDSAGNLYVADLGNRRVLKINSAGVASVFADAGDGLFTPLGLAIDNQNNVLVSDALTSKIYRFTPAGVGSLLADAADGLMTPTGLALDPNGDLYAADYLGNRVMRITPSGIASIYADSSTGLSSPFDVAAAPFFAPGTRDSSGLSWASLTRSVAVPEPSGWGLWVAATLTLGGSWARRRAR